MKNSLKSSPSSLSLRCALVVAALSTGVACAQDMPATSTTEPAESTSKGAGATKLRTTEAATTPGALGSVTATSFIKDAHQANLAEVALADVAARKAQSTDVKTFAKQMREDHQKANRDLEPIARAHNVTLDQTLDAKHQKMVERFEKMSGSEFDKEFMTEMLRDHQKVINKFEQASRNAADADVKQYAQTTLPTLRQHLHHAQQTARMAGVDQATISAIVKESDAMGGTSDDMEKESGKADKDKSKY